MIKQIILLLLLASNCFGATYYVATTGNNSTGDGSIGNPWATPAYGAQQLASGDTLMVRAGTYQITPTYVAFGAAIAPTADNTTIKAYPGESVTLIGNSGVSPTGAVIGNATGAVGSWKNNLTIDGFIIQGMVSMSWASGLITQNCDISVGGDGWSGTSQGGVIMVQTCTDCTIRNNQAA